MKFQNIRDTNFAFVFCLALYPHKAYGWMIPKAEVWQNGKVKTSNIGVTSQHKGADAWIHVDPDDVESWLEPYGGPIERAMRVFQQSV